MQWTSLQVLLRTLWTNVKEANTARNIVTPTPIHQNCSNCHIHPEHTVHLLFECHIAQEVWTVVQGKFNECAARLRNGYVPVIITRDQVMFNHPPEGLNKYEVRDLIDFIIIIKHVLYRLKYRERIERVPSSRLILTITCMELEKVYHLKGLKTYLL